MTPTHKIQLEPGEAPVLIPSWMNRWGIPSLPANAGDTIHYDPEAQKVCTLRETHLAYENRLGFKAGCWACPYAIIVCGESNSREKALEDMQNNLQEIFDQFQTPHLIQFWRREPSIWHDATTDTFSAEFEISLAGY